MVSKRDWNAYLQGLHERRADVRAQQTAALALFGGHTCEARATAALTVAAHCGRRARRLWNLQKAAWLRKRQQGVQA